MSEENTNTNEETAPKHDPRKVTVDAVIDMCVELGCEHKELKSFHQITAPEFNKKCLYIGKAKKQMTRMDISGFTIDNPAIKQLSEEDAKQLKLGAVRGMLLPKEIRDEECDVLEVVRQCVTALLADEEGFKLAPRSEKEDDESVTETTSDEESVDDEEDLDEEAYA